MREIPWDICPPGVFDALAELKSITTLSFNAIANVGAPNHLVRIFSAYPALCTLRIDGLRFPDSDDVDIYPLPACLRTFTVQQTQSTLWIYYIHRTLTNGPSLRNLTLHKLNPGCIEALNTVIESHGPSLLISTFGSILDWRLQKYVCLLDPDHNGKTRTYIFFLVGREWTAVKLTLLPNLQHLELHWFVEYVEPNTANDNIIATQYSLVPLTLFQLTSPHVHTFSFNLNAIASAELPAVWPGLDLPAMVEKYPLLKEIELHVPGRNDVKRTYDWIAEQFRWLEGDGRVRVRWVNLWLRE